MRYYLGTFLIGGLENSVTVSTIIVFKLELWLFAEMHKQLDECFII